MGLISGLLQGPGMGPQTQGGIQTPDDEFEAYNTVQNLPGSGDRDPYAGQRFQGVPQGQMTQTPYGFDFTSPGVAEQLWQAHQQQWMQPTYADAAMAQYTPQLTSPGAMERYQAGIAPQAGQLSASEQLARGPGLDPYYARQRELASREIASEMAARGILGSTATGNLIADRMTDLAAEQANREAAYAQGVAGQADQQRMNRLLGFGQLAGAAQGAEMGRVGQGIGAAMGAGNQALAQQNALMQAALQAQEARRSRGQDYFANLANMTIPLMGMTGQGLQGIIGADQAAQDASIAAALGLPQEALAQDYRTQAQHREDINMAMDIAPMTSGAGGWGQGPQGSPQQQAGGGGGLPVFGGGVQQGNAYKIGQIPAGFPAR